MSTWECPQCRSINGERHQHCEVCGTSAPPLRPFQRPHEPKNAVLDSQARLDALRARRAEPDDPCTEPGCTKLVRDHIAEFRALMDAWMVRNARVTRKVEQIDPEEIPF